MPVPFGAKVPYCTTPGAGNRRQAESSHRYLFCPKYLITELLVEFIGAEEEFDGACSFRR
jgi:hypothetical protein